MTWTLALQIALLSVLATALSTFIIVALRTPSRALRQRCPRCGEVEQ